MRDPNSHKGQNGRVLVIAGSYEYVGAASLTAIAAQRCGVDLVHLVTNHDAGIVASNNESMLIVHKYSQKYFLEEHVPMALELAQKCDSVVIGPGLGSEEQTLAAIKLFLLRNTKPVVIDADAISAISGALLHGSIVTPHSTEFKLLFNEDANSDSAKRYANKDTIILLKGNPDIITDGSQYSENTLGNSSMTKGGTGDVLAGLCAGFLALGNSKYHSAQMAAVVNGLVGDYLFEEMENGWVTSQMLSQIPKAIIHAQQQRLI